MDTFSTPPGNNRNLLPSFCWKGTQTEMRLCVLGLVFPFTDSALLLSGRQRSAMTIKKGFSYSPRTLHSTLQHELHAAGGTECRAWRQWRCNHTYLHECMFCNLIFLHGLCLQIIISRRLPLLVKYSCWGCSTLSHPSTRINGAVPLLHYSRSNERPAKCNSGDGDLLCIPRSLALFVCHGIGPIIGQIVWACTFIVICRQCVLWDRSCGFEPYSI